MEREIVNKAREMEWDDPFHTWDEITDQWDFVRLENQAVLDRGGVLVSWEDGWLVLQSKNERARYRGSSVEGCDATDSFVQHLASELN